MKKIKPKSELQMSLIGVRLSENPECWSHPRYKVAVTSCKSESYGNFLIKAVPNVRQM